MMFNQVPSEMRHRRLILASGPGLHGCVVPIDLKISPSQRRTHPARGAWLDVFACAGCCAELTAPVSRVALPVHTHHGAWEYLHPPLMASATYAVDPQPTGPPWQLWEEVGEEAAARKGVYASTSMSTVP